MIGQEECEHTKGVIGIRKSKKDRKHDETRKMYIIYELNYVVIKRKPN